MGPDTQAALSGYERRRAPKRALVASLSVLLVLAASYKAAPFVELGLARPQEYSAAEGAVRTVRLPDGTRLALAGGAGVRVRYTSHHRAIELMRGTIFADVVHDAKRPFRIDAGNGRVSNIGTSFEVMSNPANVRVSVASGTVRFGGSGWFDTPITLNARQAALLDKAGVSRLPDVEPDHVAAWRNEWVEYRGAPLWQVVSDLQSLSPLPIRIADQALADKPVSGRMRLTDPLGQLERLAVIHAFHLTRTDDALVLTKD